MGFGPGSFISLSHVSIDEKEMLSKINIFIWWQLEESSIRVRTCVQLVLHFSIGKEKWTQSLTFSQ